MLLLFLSDKLPNLEKTIQVWLGIVCELQFSIILQHLMSQEKHCFTYKTPNKNLKNKKNIYLTDGKNITQMH